MQFLCKAHYWHGPLICWKIVTLRCDSDTLHNKISPHYNFYKKRKNIGGTPWFYFFYMMDLVWLKDRLQLVVDQENGEAEPN